LATRAVATGWAVGVPCGRGPATALTAMTLKHFGVRSVQELVHEVHGRDPRRHRISSLAESVQAAAAEGDVLARQIVQDASDELLAAAGSVAERLEMRGSAFPFVLAGGVFQGVPLLRESVLRRLPEVAPRCQPQVLTEEPALGAVRLAIAEARGGAAIPTYI
jgi:N-acetylglucosamine kinase-like BadF-type ATPase